MKGKMILAAVFLLICIANICSSQNLENQMKNEEPEQENPIVEMKTSLGNIKIELFEDKAPQTVKNFLGYVNEGFYDHTIFHRVIDGFMVQGGGFTKDMKQKQTKAPIVNEANNGLSNAKGTIAMARTSDPNSATAQFFINVSDNAFLNFRGKSGQEWGYCVFGKVVEGMDVIEKMKKAKTANSGPHQNVPVETIEIVEAVQAS